MNRPVATALFVASIVLFPAAVKTRAADLASGSKSDLKDSVKDMQDEFKQIVDYMMRNGADASYGEGLAQVLGLPGARPLKGHNIRSKKSDKNHVGLNCGVAYEESSEATTYGGRRPICIFLQTMKISGQDVESWHYRLNLDGHLERAILSHSKNDESGHIVTGSAVDTNGDINSPEVKKALASELADLRQWLKQQTKVVAKTATASTAKPEDAVRASAETASAAVDREASAAPAESATSTQ
jgi:hypothetical protein